MPRKAPHRSQVESKPRARSDDNRANARPSADKGSSGSGSDRAGKLTTGTEPLAPGDAAGNAVVPKRPGAAAKKPAQPKEDPPFWRFG